MTEPRPRNWKAMREDRVLAMAENRFGERFATKDAAIARLQQLTPREQRALTKVAVSKSERARRASASDRMIAGMSQEAKGMTTIPDRLKGLKTAQLKEIAREVGIPVNSKSTAAGLRKAMAQRVLADTRVGAQSVRVGELFRDVSSADVAASANRARSASEAKISAAIDKVSAPRAAGAAGRLTKALGSPAFGAELAAVTKGMKAAEVKALAKEFTAQSAASKAVALKRIEGRNSALLTSLSKSRATGGRIAGALALAVGVGAALADAGGSSAEAAQKKRQSGPSKNTVAAKEADAKAKAAEAAAKQADADAAKAATEAKRLELQAEAQRADRMDKRREADKAPLEQLRQVAIVAAPLAAGMAYGKNKAEAIQARAKEAAAATNRQLDKVSKKIRGSRDVAKLTAGVRVADRMRPDRLKGPVGGLTAAFLVTEAVAARYIAHTSENETTREVMNGAAIGLGAAAVSTVGTRMVQRATSSILPNASAMVDIETARETIKGNKSAPRPRATPGGVLAKASKLALPLIAGVAAYSAFVDSADAGQSTGEAAGAGAKAAGDVMTGGAISEYDRAKARGAGEAEALATGASMGAINMATFGLAPMANEALADKGGVPGAISEVVVAAAGKAGELLGWSDAAREASAESRAASASVTSQLARELFGGTANAGDAPATNGAEEDKSVSEKIGGTIIGGLGGAMVLNGREALKAPKVYDLPGGKFHFDGTPATRGASVARVVKGGGLIGAGVTLAGLGLAIAGGNSNKAAPSGKAFLNSGAERKASLPPKAPASTVAAAAAQNSDGQTAGYTRRGRNGNTIQVKAYRTPTSR